MSDFRDLQDENTPAIPEDEPVQSTGQSSTSWSSSGWSGSDKWTYGYRKYRHVQNGAARATVTLVGLSLLQPGDAASTISILAPFGSGGALILIAKLYLFSSTMKVVNKVSGDADFLMESATDATEQAIAWTLKLYQIVGLLLSSVVLWGSYKWANSMGLTKPQPAAGPTGPAPDTTTLFAQYGEWLTESKVRSVARNPTRALNIAAVSSNIRPMPEEEGVWRAWQDTCGSCTEYAVTG